MIDDGDVSSLIIDEWVREGWDSIRALLLSEGLTFLDIISFLASYKYFFMVSIPTSTPSKRPLTFYLLLFISSNLLSKPSNLDFMLSSSFSIPPTLAFILVFCFDTMFVMYLGKFW